MKGNMLQSDDVMVLNIRVRMLQIDHIILLLKKFFPYSNETEEESE